LLTKRAKALSRTEPVSGRNGRRGVGGSWKAGEAGLAGTRRSMLLYASTGQSCEPGIARIGICNCRSFAWIVLDQRTVTRRPAELTEMSARLRCFRGSKVAAEEGTRLDFLRNVKKPSKRTAQMVASLGS